MSARLSSSDFAKSLQHLLRLQESRHEHIEVLYYLSAEGGAVPQTELVQVITPSGAEDSRAVLSALVDAGLLRHRRLKSAGAALPVTALVDHLEPLFQLPTFYRNRLRRRLANCDVGDLRRMAGEFYSGTPRPVPADSRNTVALLASFKAMILDRKAFRRAVERHFDEAERALLKILSMHHRGLQMREIRRHLGYFGHRLGFDETKQLLQEVYRTSGLIYTSEGDSFLRRDRYFPAEMRVMLVQDAVEMVKSNFGLGTPPRQIYPTFGGRLQPEAWKVRHEPAMVFHNAMVILIYLISHRVPRIQKGGVHKSEIKRINAQFNPPQEDHYLFGYLFDYFEQHGIVRLVNEVWAVDVSQAVAFFSDPPKTLRRLAEDYFEADLLKRGECEKRMEAADSGVLDPLRVIWILRHLSPESWTGAGDLAHFYARAEGGFKSESHQAGVEKFIGFTLEKPLFWFGLVELSHHPEGGGALFRLSERGRAVLLEDRIPDELDRLFDPEERLLVQANLEVFLPGRFLPEGTMFLARFADYERGRFRLSSQSLSRGLDSGLSLEKIRGFLDRSSSQAIPQNVDYLLREVSSRHGHMLVDPQLMVLKTEDPFLMKEMSLVPGLRRYFLARFDKTIMLLAPGVKVPRLVEELRRLGYMPRVRWDAVIDEDQEQLELDADDRRGLLALLKAFEYSDEMEQDLSSLLIQVGKQLNSEDLAAKQAIPQRGLGQVYKVLERINAAVGAGKLD